MSIKKTTEKDKTLYAYSLFSGGGGFHIGIEKAGFKVLVSTDIEPTAEATHRHNWPTLPFLLKDIRKISGNELLKLAGGIKPDLIFGGPPCQGFSTLGAKLSGDPRNTLFDHFVRIVDELNPKCFLFENVKSLTTMYHGQYKDYILKKFENIGYRITWKILDSADYGVPQHRQRVFFFGTRFDRIFEFPQGFYGPHTDNPFRTVQEIMDLADLTEKDIPNHIALNHSDIVVARYKLIKEGCKLPPKNELPKELQRTNFGNTYKRLSRYEPSLTMVPGNNAFPIHPTLNRSLTPREAARLQTFPDTHVFCGDRRKQCILVGNAVPPLVAEVLGRVVKEHLQKCNGYQILNKNEGKKTKVIKNSKIFEENLPLKHCLKLSDKSGFIDLFSGAGGFTIGFTKGGWKPLLSVDINANVSLTHIDNMPSLPFMKGDLSNDSFKEQVLKQFNGRDIGIVVGGPPCQGFSIFGKRRFVNTKGYNPHVDPRNKLVYSFLDIVRNVNPRWFLMENVPGLANLDDGLFLKSLIEEFKSIGYSQTEYRVLNAADYGVPQLRKRLIVIGNRTGHIIPWPKKKFFENPKDWQKPFRTVAEAISDLADEQSYSKFTCHIPMNHKPLLVERYKYIKEGEKLNLDSLPASLKSGYRTDEVKNYSHVFKRLDRNKPATTMVPGHNAFPIHPFLNRALTVREAARIQTFPDELEFKGSRQEQCIQVGNAFPPLLAEVIANNIRKAEINGWFPDSVPASAWYALIEKPSESNKEQI